MGSKTQLNLLASCIFYEDKKLYRKLSIRPFQDNYNMNFQLQKRPLLSKIMNILKPISKKYDISRFEMNCQVPGLNIIGITGYRKQIYKVVNIEILDEYTVLKNTQNMPTGLMQLKLRLLEKLDEALIVVSSNLRKYFYVIKCDINELYIAGLDCLISKMMLKDLLNWLSVII